MSSKHTIFAETVNSFGIPLKSNGSKATTTVIAIRETEKPDVHDMNYLNHRFAAYVERVRFLEGQNRKLQLEIDQIRSQWTSQKHRLKEMYEIEVREACHIIDDTEKDRIEADLRVRHAEQELTQLKDKFTSLVGKGSDRRKIDQLQKQICDNEADIHLFHRRLNDLQEEQKRYRMTSQNLILDIQQITKELDHEIITRVQLENQKEKLEEEIELLKRLHAQKIEQIKQISLINVSFDPTNLFEHQLSTAIKTIRAEYDQRNYHLRNELEAWYQWKVAQAIQDVQSCRAIEQTENVRSKDEFRKLEVLMAESRQDIAAMRQRNGSIENRIRELEKSIRSERDGQIRATDEHYHQIQDLQARLDELDRDYTDVISTKSSLHSEIAGYRKLLDGREHSASLAPLSTQPLNHLQSERPYADSYPRFRTKPSSGPILRNNYSILTPCVPFRSVESTQTETTIFDKVYGRHRRPLTISSNIPWTSIVEHSWSQQWNEGDVIQTRSFKAKTFYEASHIRGLRRRKSITPPSSDYTDAYLSMFAPKPNPRRSMYRLTTPIFANVEPLPSVSRRIDLSTDNEFRTSETRFNPVNSILTSNSFDRANLISAPSSNLLSVSSKDSSSFENQLSDSNYSSSKEITDVQPQLSSSAYLVTDRSESPYENIAIMAPPTDLIPSLSSSPKPSVSRQSSLVNDTNQDDVNLEKAEKLNASLMFIDEDTHPTPVMTSTLESAITPTETKPERERAPSVDLSDVAARPIEMLENTITKYDTLINEISDILASVSPIHSTLSSMSPNKNVVDHEVSSDSSPTLPPKRVETQKLPGLIKKPCIQRAKRKDMIRGDSYSKIITAIIDLDKEMTPPMDISKPPSIEQIKEEVETEPIDEDRTLTLSNDTRQTATMALTTERQQEIPLVIDSIKINKASSMGENQMKETHAEIATDVADNDNQHIMEERVPSESSTNLTEQEHIYESNKPVSSISAEAFVSDIQDVVQEHLLSQPAVAETIPDAPQIPEASTVKLQLAPLKIRTKFHVRQIKSISSIEASSSSSEFADRRTTSLDSGDFQIGQDEPLNITKDALNPQLVATTESFQQGASSAEEHPVNIETGVQLVPENEANQNEISIPPVNIIEDEAIIMPPPFPTIVSPIDRLSDLISNRYISSDVYHGYLGDHTQFVENAPEIDSESIEQSILTALRQTISTSITSHMEDIPNVVTSMQMKTPVGMNDQETDHSLQYDTNRNKEITETHEKHKSVTNDSSTQKQENLPTILSVESIFTKDMKKSPTPSSSEQLNDSAINLTESTNTLPAEATQETILLNEIEAKAEQRNFVDVKTPSVAEPILSPVEEMQAISVIPSASTGAPEESTTDFAPYVVSDADVPIMINDASSSTTPAIQTDLEALEINVMPGNEIDMRSQEDISEIEYASIELTDTSIADERLEDATPSFVSVDDTLASMVCSTSFSLTRDQPVINKASEIQIVPTGSFLLEEVEQIAPYEKSPTLASEERASPTTIISKKLTTEDTSQFPPSSTSAVALENTDILATKEMSELKPADNHHENIVQKLMNNTTEIVSSQSETTDRISEDPVVLEPITIEIDNDVLQQLTSTNSEYENVVPNLNVDLGRISPTNTEPNSFELIHALRGHSIASPLSLDQHFRPQEKSTSSTTSSPITSSDRYVSYAIHQMHDSSQDRLPVIPISEDMPNYAIREEKRFLQPLPVAHRSALKDDDLTEFDASDNLTSQSDDILYRRLYRSSPCRLKNLDTSSTDEDVDEEFEEHDLTNIHRISDKTTETSSSISTHDERYHRYDLVTTPSSHESSPALAKQQLDDVYIIPGYPGLWRTTTDEGDTSLPIDYDADDETKGVVRTRIAAPVSDSLRRPLSFQPHRDQTMNSIPTEILTTGIPLRPDTLDAFNQPANELAFDISEADSYQTCPSSIARPQRQMELTEHEQLQNKVCSSPEESIFLICERERGVSLPITMNINCDEITFRLSTSTPNDAQLCPSIETDLSSNPLLKPSSPNPTSMSSLSIQKSNQQIPSTWLNNVNTVTTTTEGSDGPLQSRVTFQKSAKGPISISECHTQGHYIVVDNTSQSKNIDLTNWIICQENNTGEKIHFTFPEHAPLKANHSLKILAKAFESELKNNDDLIATSVSTWHTGSHIVTTLINPDGKERATLTKKTFIS
ncbi:unnamed protein product [Adineta ricciae]|uniref:IF rod domain-containing protein n=1 Tax=Adineta ricciae TaxID=249248 RepID=A0A815Z0F3_ADIRI|nr:unnamed protein product [Adineta ricciae]CAF1576418.1 unnamed protein product [Adineta ricciae]